MSQYTKSTNFTSKDALPSGNPLKIVKGAEFDTEFNAIATAVNSKADTDSPAFTGTPTAPTPASGTSTGQLATTAFVMAAGLPAGVIVPYGGSTAPTGYLLCDGSAVSRTTYAALYAAIGTLHGAGDGTTTFNVPNAKGRVPMGPDVGFVVGSRGGSKDAIVPAHSHTATTTINDPGHAHVGGATSGGGVSYAGTGANEAYQAANTGTSPTGIWADTTVNSTGVSATNANLPPYFVTNYIIKT